MQHMFSCLNRLADKKFGILSATLACKKNLLYEHGRWMVKVSSYDNDFQYSVDGGKELKISILNRSIGFNTMIGCLAGRTKYKSPVDDVPTIDLCMNEASQKRSVLDLIRMNYSPSPEILTPMTDEPKDVQALSRGHLYFYKCLAFFGQKKSQGVYPNDDDIFNFCIMNLDVYLNKKEKVNQYFPSDVEFRSSNYSLRMIYALEQIVNQNSQRSPLDLAVKLQLDSEIALQNYREKIQKRQAIDDEIPFPLKFLRQ